MVVETGTKSQRWLVHPCLNLRERLTNAEIGAQIHLSEGTIRNYISTILDKLQVKDRTQAVVTAIRYGLINV